MISPDNGSHQELLMGVETPIPPKMIIAAAPAGAPPRRIETVEIYICRFSWLGCEPDRFMFVSTDQKYRCLQILFMRAPLHQGPSQGTAGQNPGLLNGNVNRSSSWGAGYLPVIAIIHPAQPRPGEASRRSSGTGKAHNNFLFLIDMKKRVDLSGGLKKHRNRDGCCPEAVLVTLCRLAGILGLDDLSAGLIDLFTF
jgi:hypothetical protein